MYALVCMLLIHFTGAKFPKNDLKATGDMAIFILFHMQTWS